MIGERITLVEVPALVRYMSDDGQVVDIEAHSEQAARLAALAYFEAKTKRQKPTKQSEIWVKIEGRAVLRRSTHTSPGSLLSDNEGK